MLGPSLSNNLHYRGKPSADFSRKSKTLLPSLNVCFTTIKLKNILSNLKSPVPSSHRSSIVYKLTCPSCSGIYIGQTVRHLFVRVKEHGQKGTPIGDHFKACGRTVDLNNAEILDIANNLKLLLTFESLYIRQQRPCINTRDEFCSRALFYAF